MDATLVAQSAFGFLVLHALAWAVSENRRGVIWRTLSVSRSSPTPEPRPHSAWPQSPPP
jgi:hypothetical protein